MPSRLRPLLPFFPLKPLALACSLSLAGMVQAQTYIVSTEAELRAAIIASNSAPGANFIEFAANIHLSGPLPPLLATMTLKGNGKSLSGDGDTRLLMIGASAAEGGPRILVQVANLVLRDGYAQGGNGSAGGGGGLGAGGAIFVNSQADVVLDRVTVADNAAQGGNGAAGSGGGGGGLGGAAGAGAGSGGGGIYGQGGDGSAGGGGGLLGQGGDGAAGSGGGGGFSAEGGDTGNGGTGNLPVYWQSGAGGQGVDAGGTSVSSGGSNGGGGGGSPDGAGGGGGYGGGSATVAQAGAGGFGGGGGGALAGAGGDGGYGGGGGGSAVAAGGQGGFGGGGGGALTTTGGDGGFGGGGGSGALQGGDGGYGAGGGAGAAAGAGGLAGGDAGAAGGGGGAGLGGAIFVAQGGNLTLGTRFTLAGNTAVAGSGAAGAGSGEAAGGGIFLQGSGNLVFNVSNSDEVSVFDDIADAVGSGLAAPGSYDIWNVNIRGGGGVLDGVENTYGRVSLLGNNRYAGDTYVTGAHLALGNNPSLLSAGGLFVLDDGGLILTPGTTLLRDVVASGGGAHFIVEGTGQAVLGSDLSGSGPLIKAGQGTLLLASTSNTLGSGAAARRAVGEGARGRNSDASLGGSNVALELQGGGIRFNSAFNDLRQFAISSRGGFVDNGGYTVHLTEAVTGAGEIEFMGAGQVFVDQQMFNLGGTKVAAGTVTGRIGHGRLTVEAAGIYELGGADQLVGKLSGSGIIRLGADDLTTYFSGASLLPGVENQLLKSEFAGSLQGSGRLIKSGTWSELLLSGNNSNAGGVDIVSGWVSINSDANIGGGKVVMHNSGQIFNQETPVLETKAMLQYLQAGTSSLDIQLDNGGYIKTAVDGVALTGVISGTGGLLLTGGEIFLNGTGAYTGGTVVLDSSLVLARDTALGSGVLRLMSGELHYDGSFTDTHDMQVHGISTVDVGSFDVVHQGDISEYSGTIGPATLKKTGNGRLTLLGDLSVGGVTMIDAGILQVGNGGSSGNVDGSVLVESIADIVFNRSDTVTVQADINGQGRLLQIGSGVTILQGSNGISGGVIVRNGMLGIDDDLRLGASSLLLDGGLIRYEAAFDNLRSMQIDSGGGGVDTHGFDVSYQGVFSGTGPFTKTGQGRFSVIGTELNADTVRVREGELRIGNGAGNGGISGDVEIDAGATLALDRGDDYSYGGQLTGSGDFRQLGSGMLILPGDSSAFAGHSFIDAGRLRLDGRLGGDMVVSSGAVLQGTGLLGGDLQLAAGSRLAPGNSIGTLAVGGNLLLDATATTDIEVDGTAATSQSDRITVAGSATLGGTLHIAGLPGDYSQSGRRFTFLTASTVSGQFAALQNDLAFLSAVVDYSQPGQVDLILGSNGAGFSSVSYSYNQQQVATALDALGAQDPAHPLVQLVTPLTAAQARDAYDVLSGDSLLNTVNAAARSARRFNHLLSARSSRLGLASRGASTESLDKSLSAVRKGLMPEAPLAFTQAPDPRHYDGPTSRVEGLWVEANAFKSSEDSDEVVGSAASRFDGNLLALGVDGYWGNNLILGFGAGYLQGSMSYDNRQGDGDATGSFVGSYGRWEADSGWHYKAALTLGQQSTDQTRSGSIGASSGKAVSTVDVQSATAEFEAGLGLHAGNYGLRPYALLEVQYLKRDAIHESGAAAADLEVEAANDVAGEFGVGAEISRPWLTDGARWAQLQAGLALLQPFGDTQRQQTVHFSGASNSYTVKATPDDSAAVQLTLGGEWYFSRALALWGGYEGRISSSTQEHNGVISIQYRW